MKKLWQMGWRVALCAALLVWIFHCIFVTEVRLDFHQAGRAGVWDAMTKFKQWRLGWQEGPPRLWHTLTLIDPWMFALSLVLMGATILLGVIRWRMVLRVQGLNLPLSRAMEISFVAQFFNSFLLGSTGGDLMKALYAARETHHKKTEAVVTVFVDRLLGLWAMLLFAGVMMLPNLKLLFGQNAFSFWVSMLILGMLAACTVIVALAFRGGVSRHWTGARQWLRRLPKGAWLEHSLDSCRRFGQEPWFVLRTLGVSTLLNIVCVLQWMVVGHGLGMSIPPWTMFALVPIVICISALPLTPSGLGVRETLFVNLLVDPMLATPGLSLSLLAVAGSFVWSIVGGVVYLLLKDRHHLGEAELATTENDSSDSASARLP